MSHRYDVGMTLCTLDNPTVKQTITSELMCRILRPAPFAYRGMCQLFEMFLLMTFNTFSEVSIADLLEEQLPQVTHPLLP